MPTPSRILVLAVCLVSSWLSAPHASGQEITNPELFGKSLEAATRALEFYGSYDDRLETRRVADLAYRLAQESTFRDFPFSFFLVDIPVPNAFALPGGHIFITRGMLDLEPSDDMLAGLLGHEIGHVVLEHGTKMQRRATLLNVLSQALLAGVIIASDNDTRDAPAGYDPWGGGSNSGDRVMGAAAAGVVVSELLLRSYSREFEDEADDEGQRLAAAAGFDPDGYGKLMELMRERLPESNEYGYWRTHPFFDTRVNAAGVRADLLKTQEPTPADEFRRRTQEVLLSYQPKSRKTPPPEKEGRAGETLPDDPKGVVDSMRVLEDAALIAWPLGAHADRIRLARLHEERDAELQQPELSRDFGRLATLYEETVVEIRELNPESELLASLEGELEGFEESRSALYEKAAEVFAGGVYETEFLETFFSNFSESEESTRIAVALGNAYSRLQRHVDAVGMYLEASKAGSDSEPGRQASKGLRSLATVLDDLGALQQLAAESMDDEVRQLAQARLVQSADSYKRLQNGSSFLKRYPESDLTPRITARLNSLAENLYGEAILYQRVGDHAKALERIHAILTEAPLSPAAAKLRRKAVLES
ncbi:MAG: M48 family metallopeptidase [Acidobacteriota bacterium]|nr:M48 family metallopeptidase [Acidobacteriota bacterium]